MFIPSKKFYDTSETSNFFQNTNNFGYKTNYLKKS